MSCRRTTTYVLKGYLVTSWMSKEKVGGSGEKSEGDTDLRGRGVDL